MHQGNLRAIFLLNLDLGWPSEPCAGYIVDCLILAGLKGVSHTNRGRYQLVLDTKDAIKRRLQALKQSGRKFQAIAKYPDDPNFLPEAVICYAVCF